MLEQKEPYNKGPLVDAQPFLASIYIYINIFPTFAFVLRSIYTLNCSFAGSNVTLCTIHCARAH